MKTIKDLEQILQRIDGKGYKAYKDIQGSYDCDGFILHVDNVQSDPFASPSKIRVAVDQSRAQFPEKFFSTPTRRVALEDYLTRQVAEAIENHYSRKKGSGKSGAMSIDQGGQEVLERTSLKINAKQVEARLSLGLPARGRKILGRQAQEILTRDLAEIVENSLLISNLEEQDLEGHILVVEDQEFLREKLLENNWLAFIGNGAILPRKSGISDKPLRNDPISFQAPSEMEVTVDLPNQGRVSGMGIPEGVNLIVGGGYHGKSTLLKALERGVYDHVPGDGRELVVARSDAFKIRAEDGRNVAKVDISPFIGDLPQGKDTVNFSTDNASGSTSQAVNIMEALEADSQLLLLDEDTSATNFMIRDSRMQKLVSKENEPITPFIDRVQQMYQTFGISTIVVLGGSGDYLDVADKVIMMKEYEPFEVTEQGKKIAEEYQSHRTQETKKPFEEIKERKPELSSWRLSPKGKVKSKGLNTIIFDKIDIDLSLVEQLVDSSQTSAVAEILKGLDKKSDQLQGKSLNEIAEYFLDVIRSKGLDAISSFYGQHPGNLAMPRKQEICAAINRFRKLRIK